MKKQVLFPEEEMMGQMKELWKECFGDSKDYIEFYYKNRFQKENTLVYCVEEKVVSMLTMLPAQIKKEKKYIPVRYIYAVGTKEEYRGLGYAKRLLEEAEGITKVPLILIPATLSLFSFYEKLGFKTNFYLSKIDRRIRDMRMDKRILKIADAREYKQIRDQKLEQEGYIKWNEDAVAYALEENRRQQGEAYLIENPETEEQDILLVREKGKGLDILELSGIKKNLFSIPEELQKKYPTKEVFSFYISKETFLQEVFSEESLRKEIIWKESEGSLKISENAFAMSKGLELKQGYFNLGLQ